MSQVDELRKRIDALDAQIIKLLNERSRLSEELGSIKRNRGAPILDPSRENAVLENVGRVAESLGLEKDDVQSIYRHIIAFSRKIQGEDIRVAFLGPSGTFTEQAARTFFQTRNAHYVEKSGIPEIFRAVATGEADYGVVPVENSTEGSVNIALDLLSETELKVCGEIEQRIRHNLIVPPRLEKSKIRGVLSHPQAFAQCRKFLEESLPNARVKEAPSTAAAVKMLIRTKNAAAIGPELAAETYGMRIIAKGIEDNPQNYTRFLVLANQDGAITGKDKTSVIFSVKHVPGALHSALQAFAKRDINLTKIESRPTRLRPWEYLFYCDFEGHKNEEKCRQALEDLNEKCEFLKILGSYQRAR